MKMGFFRLPKLLVVPGGSCTRRRTYDILYNMYILCIAACIYMQAGTCYVVIYVIHIYIYVYIYPDLIEITPTWLHLLHSATLPQVPSSGRMSFTFSSTRSLGPEMYQDQPCPCHHWAQLGAWGPGSSKYDIYDAS